MPPSDKAERKIDDMKQHLIETFQELRQRITDQTSDWRRDHLIRQNALNIWCCLNGLTYTAFHIHIRIHCRTSSRGNGQFYQFCCKFHSGTCTLKIIKTEYILTATAKTEGELFCLTMYILLTHSTPDVPNCCHSKGSVPYWSNPPFLIFDIRALWHSVLSTRVPECQKLKMVG